MKSLYPKPVTSRGRRIEITASGKRLVCRELPPAPDRTKAAPRKTTAQQTFTRRLRRYGLTPDLWQHLCDIQRGGCAVCEKPIDLTFHIDHEHVDGWATMPPAQRVRFVRGILCSICNTRYCDSGMTPKKAAAVATYLTASGPFTAGG